MIPDMPPGMIAIAIMKIIVPGIVMLGLGLPFAIAFAKRIMRGGQTTALPAASADLLRSMDARLTRIEGAVESIAVEVERVTEGQRFAVKLLSESKPGEQSRLGAG